MILNLFLWKISQKFNEIKTINKDSNIAYISIVNTVKLYDRISFRIKMKFFFHEKIYYIYKMELISLFNLGYYSDAKKRCLFLLNTLLITNENKEDLKMKLCICYFKLNKIDKLLKMPKRFIEQLTNNNTL